MKAIRIGDEIISLERLKKIRTMGAKENVIFIFQYFCGEEEVWSPPITESSVDMYLDMILKILQK